ncbi:MAG: hypothetical protein NUW01_00435 [Gemmatimonadaceae bacterium]|nr:hypothetical protein [Gemmatimonadaceae bacterium]
MTLSAWSLRAGTLIAEAFTTLWGVPMTPATATVFACQVRRETANGDPDLSPGVRHGNPLNLTVPPNAPDPDHYWNGQVGTYSGGSTDEWHTNFAAFGSLEAGAWACAVNYSSVTYENVRDALRGGDPIALAEAIQQSPWDSGHYGGTLVAEVRAELGQEEEMTEEQIREIAKAECRAVLSQEDWLRDTVKAAVLESMAEASRRLAA